MSLFQAPLDTPLDSPFSATLSVHGLHFTVCALSIHVQKRGYTKFLVFLKRVILLNPRVPTNFVAFPIERTRKELRSSVRFCGLVNNCSGAAGRAPNWTGRTLNSFYPPPKKKLRELGLKFWRPANSESRSESCSENRGFHIT